MRRGCSIGDYTVTIGTVILFNDQLLDDRLVVRLVDRDTYDRGFESSCQKDQYPVRVWPHAATCSV